MGKDLFQRSQAARRVFQAADDVLGRPLSVLCFEGPEDELRLTQNAQPAIMTVSLACLAAAHEYGQLECAPSFVAGHSLGEYTAAVAAGALSFADGLRLVQERGRLMALAGEECPGIMAALLGLDEEAAARLCAETGAEMSNVNAPGQIVIGGAIQAVEVAMERSKEFGARRAVRLNVGGAFHTSLMASAVEGMTKALSAVKIADPLVPIVANVSGEPLTSISLLQEELISQLTHPVQWQRSVASMTVEGVERFMEFGPGEVLSGLVRRISPETGTCSVNSIASLVSQT